MSLDHAKYLELFASESREHLEAMAQDLVELENPEKRAEPLASVFRHAHSVKGMAASLGFTPVERLSHRLEDVADALRKKGDAPPAEMLDLMLAAADRLREMVPACVAGSPVPEDPALMEALDRMGKAGIAAPATAPATAPAESAKASAELVAELAVGEQLFEVKVRIGGGAAAPAARAFLVHKKLKTAGRILAAEPSLEAIRAGKLADGSTLTLQVATAADALTLKKAVLTVAEIAEVEVTEPAPVQAPPAAAAPQARAAPAPPQDESTRTVRVKTELLDYLIEAGGELLIATARLRELSRALPAAHRRPLTESVDALSTIVKELHGRVMTVRMTPLSVLTARVPRMVREVARKAGKEVDVEISGADIAIDRAILDALEGAVQHVLRNAVDHGLEDTSTRAGLGKPPRGKIRISAQREKNRVLLTLADDGRGMSAERLKAAAVARGALTPEAAAALTDAQAWMLSTLPGVSTKDAVTDLSGRGVGMDAVKIAVESLGGSLEIDSTPGAGTRIHFRLPLTVAVLPTLLASVGSEVFGLPMNIVVGAVERSQADAEAGAIQVSEGVQIPAHSLARLLDVPGDPSLGPRPFVIVESSRGRTALMVDRLLGQEEAVLKPVSRPLDRIRGIGGVTILGSGRPVFILDVPRLWAA